MNQRNHSNHHIASPLTPLPGEMDPPPSTSSKSHLGNGEVSATPSRVVGNTERLGSPVRAPQLDIKLKVPRTSDSAEPARPRAYNKKVVKVFNAAQDDDLANAKDIEAVEAAMLSEPAAFTDEAIASVQKRKRKLDALREYLRLERTGAAADQATLQMLQQHRRQKRQITGTGVWALLAGEEQALMRFSYRVT